MESWQKRQTFSFCEECRVEKPPAVWILLTSLSSPSWGALGQRMLRQLWPGSWPWSVASKKGNFMKGARPICFCKIYLKRSPVPSAGRSFSSQYLIGNRVPRDRGSANSCTSGTSCANCKESAQDKCKGSHRAQLRPINCVDKQSCRLKLRQFTIFPLSSIHCNTINRPSRFVSNSTQGGGTQLDISR